MKRAQINQRIGERDRLYMRNAQDLPEYEKGNAGFENLKAWVENQPWYKDNKPDRHYTEEHRRLHCTCIRPKDWINEEGATEVTPQ